MIISNPVLPVATLGLAVNHRMKQSDGWKDDPCFIDVQVFGQQAERCKASLKKGQLILVEGRICYRTWQGQDGHKRSKHEISAFRVQWGEDISGQMSAEEPIDDEDVPF